ncbi:MAG: M15 family metallopeptidase [Oscillospiraceae bacterium]|nr:M15 family metallopeptidase [Oscillospiraceae bacterium]
MKNQKVYRRRGPRRNMALPLILALVLVAGVAIALVSCNVQPAPEEPAAPSGSQQEAPESSSAQEEPKVPQQSQSEETPEEEPVEESSQSQQQTHEAPVTELESDGEEIAIPASLAGADHLFPAGNGDYRLILVNKEYTMPNEISDLPLKNIGDGYRVQADMYDALVKMMDDAKAAGLPLYIVSGYRPIERSRVLYENKVQEYLNAGYSAEEAAVQAGMWIAPPGTSEHSTGLAVDLISADYYTKLPDLLPEFEEFEEAKWMKEHCAEYGFILRFPKGKEDITKVVFEPWHFRYVGVEAATAIMEQGITLEEYLGVA